MEGVAHCAVNESMSEGFLFSCARGEGALAERRGRIVGCIWARERGSMVGLPCWFGIEASCLHML